MRVSPQSRRSCRPSSTCGTSRRTLPTKWRSSATAWIPLSPVEAVRIYAHVAVSSVMASWQGVFRAIQIAQGAFPFLPSDDPRLARRVRTRYRVARCAASAGRACAYSHPAERTDAVDVLCMPRRSAVAWPQRRRRRRRICNDAVQMIVNRARAPCGKAQVCRHEHVQDARRKHGEDRGPQIA